MELSVEAKESALFGGGSAGNGKTEDGFTRVVLYIPYDPNKVPAKHVRWYRDDCIKDCAHRREAPIYFDSLDRGEPGDPKLFAGWFGVAEKVVAYTNLQNSEHEYTCMPHIDEFRVLSAWLPMPDMVFGGVVDIEE